MIKLSQTYIKKCKTKFNNEKLKEAVKEWRKDLKTNKNKYDHISELDTSEVTDMHGLFQNYIGINQDISKWNVSNVIDCKSFDQDAHNWIFGKPNFVNCNVKI